MNRNINIDLFQDVNFVSHSGLNLTWKIECDALNEGEWNALAKMIREYESRSWSEVIGIPRGGIPLANALSKYSVNNSKHPKLIVDDVYTTGKSFRDFSENYPDENLIKWCVFARNPIKELDIKALFNICHKGSL